MRARSAAVLVVAFTLAVAGASVAGESPELGTYFTLLVGRPDANATGESILVVPGTVIASGKAAEQQAADLLRVIDELKQAYRLPTIEPTASDVVFLKPGGSGKAPSVEGGPQVKVDLLALDDEKATYRLTLTEADKTLAEPTMTVRRGGRAIVGSRDGAAAPYLFLVVEPLPQTPTSRTGDDSISEPKLLNRVRPTYPAEAKQTRLEGLVLIEVTIGTDGSVTSTKVLRGEPYGLTEAAIEAIKQWRYEPARNSAGKPVSAIGTVTVRFALY